MGSYCASLSVLQKAKRAGLDVKFWALYWIPFVMDTPTNSLQSHGVNYLSTCE